jgi:hypothetical protein
MNSKRYICQISLWLDAAQSKKLKGLVARSGLSTQAYLRHLIDGVIPNDRPPPDYYSMMRELSAIGNNLNQIAYHANSTGEIDEGFYQQNVAALDAAIARITAAVVLPRRSSCGGNKAVAN